jgi:hypothetical protein
MRLKRIFKGCLCLLWLTSGCVREDPFAMEDSRWSKEDGAGGSGRDERPADTDTSGGWTCTMNGDLYRLGDTVPVLCDGCDNACTCERDGDNRAAWRCTDCECATTCLYEDIRHFPGDTFPAADGCNECTCDLVHLGFGYTEARLTCTAKTCGPPTCERNGARYAVGEEVQIPCDGCDNRCSCELQSEREAAWACTDCQCATECLYDGVSYLPGELFTASDGCNQCECVLQDLSFGYTEARTVCTSAVCTEPLCFLDGVGYALESSLTTYCVDGSTKGCRCEETEAGDAPSWVCADGQCPLECAYMDEVYTPGDTFTASDGCNQCECIVKNRGRGLVTAETRCTYDPCTPPMCTEAGVEYAVGDAIEVLCDECDNRCLCEEYEPGRAGWTCTDCACAQTCEYDGKTFRPGETFEAADGCGQCECVLVNLGFDYTEARVICADETC